MSTTDLPGYRVVPTPPPAVVEELRNDVAAFMGTTARGPLSEPVRVTGPQAFAGVFGPPLPEVATPRAVSAFFANGGQVAWVVRIGEGGDAAGAELELGRASAGTWEDDGPTRLTVPGRRLLVAASSPGTWAEGLRLDLTYRAHGLRSLPELDVSVHPPGQAPYHAVGVSTPDLVDRLRASGHVVARFAGTPVIGDTATGNRGPASLTWTTWLTGGVDPRPTTSAYLDALTALDGVGEVALLAAPDLDRDLTGGEMDRMVAALAAAAAARQDRMVVLALPDVVPGETEARAAHLREVVASPRHRRAVAAYHPWLLAEDHAPTTADRYRPVTPVGHVCGMVARLDRERGSGWSPANAFVRDAIDVTHHATPAEQALAIGRQVNLLRCRVGGGLEVWGARTLDEGEGRFIAHRRLVHRLVRAMRRVAEPLVFDTNGPELWFTVVRAVSGVLLEAFRSGALAGDTPDQAYRVRCDETTNPPDTLDLGQVVCEVELVPAAPMEFITLRLTLGPEGLMEVVEQ